MSESTLFRAGDVVDHLPTGERWQLAIDQIGPHVFPCGMPVVRAQAIDCEAVTRASDDERKIMLLAISRSDRRDIDIRSEHARGVLAVEYTEDLSAEVNAWRDAAIAAIHELVGFVCASNSKKENKARAKELASGLGIELKE